MLPQRRRKLSGRLVAHLVTRQAAAGLHAPQPLGLALHVRRNAVSLRPGDDAPRVADVVLVGVLGQVALADDADQVVAVVATIVFSFVVTYAIEEGDVGLQLFVKGWQVFLAEELRVYHDTDRTHHEAAEVTASWGERNVWPKTLCALALLTGRGKPRSGVWRRRRPGATS